MSTNLKQISHEYTHTHVQPVTPDKGKASNKKKAGDTSKTNGEAKKSKAGKGKGSKAGKGTKGSKGSGKGEATSTDNNGGTCKESIGKTGNLDASSDKKPMVVVQAEKSQGDLAITGHHHHHHDHHNAIIIIIVITIITITIIILITITIISQL
jgi:hypothetical protein